MGCLRVGAGEQMDFVVVPACVPVGGGGCVVGARARALAQRAQDALVGAPLQGFEAPQARVAVALGRAEGGLGLEDLGSQPGFEVFVGGRGRGVSCGRRGRASAGGGRRRRLGRWIPGEDVWGEGWRRRRGVREVLREAPWTGGGAEDYWWVEGGLLADLHGGSVEVVVDIDVVDSR